MGARPARGPRPAPPDGAPALRSEPVGSPGVLGPRLAPRLPARSRRALEALGAVTVQSGGEVLGPSSRRPPRGRSGAASSGRDTCSRPPSHLRSAAAGHSRRSKDRFTHLFTAFLQEKGNSMRTGPGRWSARCPAHFRSPVNICCTSEWKRSRSCDGLASCCPWPTFVRLGHAGGRWGGGPSPCQSSLDPESGQPSVPPVLVASQGPPGSAVLYFLWFSPLSSPLKCQRQGAVGTTSDFPSFLKTC